MRRILIVLSLFILGLVACREASKDSINVDELSAERLEASEKVLKQNCQNCHAPFADADTRLAPPFFAIRKHYLKEYPEKGDFIKAIMAFVDKPSEEKVLMKGAREKFGLMPPISLDIDVLNDLAIYLYDEEQPSPHQPTSDVEIQSPESEVKRLALSTKKVLGKNLMQALSKGGKDYALSFCNLNAIRLSDSMSMQLGSTIQRVSDRPRNPENRATEAEAKLIQEYQKMLKNGEVLEPRIVKTATGLKGYHAITTMSMCLQCHGKKGADLDLGFYEEIKKLYPEDEAYGYGLDEIRGLWVIALDSL